MMAAAMLAHSRPSQSAVERTGGRIGGGVGASADDGAKAIVVRDSRRPASRWQRGGGRGRDGGTFGAEGTTARGHGGRRQDGELP